MIATLCAPYDRSVDFKSFTMSHKEIHMALTKAGKVVPEYLTIRYRMEAIRNVPALQAAVDRYSYEVPNLVMMTRVMRLSLIDIISSLSSRSRSETL
jgi:hypothetical protein